MSSSVPQALPVFLENAWRCAELKDDAFRLFLPSGHLDTTFLLPAWWRI